MLAELAAAGPVLLVLEDLHWADRSTRDLVTFLSRVLHRERIALVVTYRTDDLHRRHPLRPVVAELQRLPSVTAIDLRPLTAAAMAEHLTTLSGGLLSLAGAGPGDQPGRGQRLLRRGAAGACRGRRDGGGGPGGSTGCPPGWPTCCWPGSSGCRPPAQRVLRAAAVAGRHIDDELVLRASGLAAAEYEDADPGGGRGPPAGRRRRPRPGVPARAAARGDLRRPAARRADPAARALAELLSDEQRLSRVTGLGRRAGPPRAGQPRHPGRVHRVGAGRRRGRAAGRAGRGAPALRPGAVAVGAGPDPEKLRRPRAAATWRCARPWPRPTPATSAGPPTSCAGCSASWTRPPARCWPAGPTSGWPCSCSTSTRMPARWTRPAPRWPRCPPSRRGRSRAAGAGHPGPDAAGVTATTPGPASAEAGPGGGPGRWRAVGRRRRPGHAGPAGREERAAQDRGRLLRAGAGAGPPGRRARRRAARHLRGGPAPARARRPDRGQRDRARGHGGGRPRPGWPWRRTGTTCSTCTTWRTTTTATGTTPRRSPTAFAAPGHQRGRGPAVGHGPVHRGGPGQRRGRPAARVAGAVPGPGPVHRLHRPRPAGRACLVAGRPGGRAGPVRGHRTGPFSPGAAQPCPQLIRVGAVWLSRPGRPGRGGPGQRRRGPGRRRAAGGRAGDRARPGRAPATAAGAAGPRAWTAGAGWPAPRPSGAGPRARTSPAGVAGGARRVRAGLSATRRPGPGGGWPRRWPRRATGTRPRSSGRWPWPPPTGWAPRRCAGRWPTWAGAPGSRSGAAGPGPAARRAAARWPR